MSATLQNSDVSPLTFIVSTLTIAIMDIYKRDAVASYGTQQALADALGITRTAVAMWPDDRPIPERHALKLRYELRPDVFGDTPDEGALVAAGDPTPVLPGDAAASMNEEEVADAA